MVELLNTLLISFSLVIASSGSIILAALIGATISVVAREDRSVMGALGSFLSGVFAGIYLSKVFITYVGLPAEPLAAILAIMGRDLVRHIIRVGRENPLSLLNLSQVLKSGGSVQEEKKKED